MNKQSAIHALILVTLFGWLLVPEPLQGWLFFPVWIGACWLIFTGSREAALLRRRTWLDQYLLANSPWHRLLRGGALMTAWHLLLAALLSLFMLVKLLVLSPWLWLVLLLNLPMLLVLTRALTARMRAHIKPASLPALVRRFVVPLNVALLTLVYLVVTLNLPQPDMQGQTWNEAVAVHLDAASSQLALLAFFERSYLLVDLTLQWALQNTMGDTDRNGGLALVGWSLLMLTGSAFIWAYVRVLVGADALFRGASIDEQA
ncbi:MAG TPA: hypothetical protein ENI17_00805 [Pseudomonas xinjiangensis]|uniref:Uncharacterized protein n=2 Tax=root TaxID=1 RepID=A0A7V1BQR0_9GAMM|nr:hypothetical protein [Halopseudomonas xinjiangensis]HEC46159.1 hypothetical protein [Halopseudomonas xinjiangensis]